MRYALLIHYPQPAVPTVSQDEIKRRQGRLPGLRQGARGRRRAPVRRSAPDDRERHQRRREAGQAPGAGRAVRRDQGALGGTSCSTCPTWTPRSPGPSGVAAAQWGTVEIRPSAMRFVDGAWTARALSRGPTRRRAPRSWPAPPTAACSRILAARDGDIEAAEDCLADAFERALRTWPETACRTTRTAGCSPWPATAGATSAARRPSG